MSLVQERKLARVLDDDSIESVVQSRFRGSAYRALRNLRFHYEHGVLWIIGQVPSYYLKQIAFSLVRNQFADIRIGDRLEVISP